jgi:hypothetical protein
MSRFLRRWKMILSTAWYNFINNMADPVQTPYKYYSTTVNGSPEFSVLPFAGNTPSGYNEINASDYVTGLNQKINTFQSQINNFDPNGPYLSSQIPGWQNSISNWQSQIADAQSGKYSGGSGYTMVNGVPMTVASANQQAANEAGVANGTLQKVPIGNGFGYVPVGSAAANNINNPPPPQPTGFSQPTIPGVPQNQISAPTVNLQTGSTGNDVKQLQDYLVAHGYMTQDQVNTGYGTYGPQTTAAVLAMQKALGIDYSSGPGSYGPITRGALQNGVPSATSGTITPGSLGSAPAAPALPGTPSGSGSIFSNIMAGLAGGSSSGAGASAGTGTGSSAQNLLDYLKSSTPPPSTADAYAAASTAAGIAAKQKTVNDLTAQLNAVLAEAGVANQKLESDASGKDETSAFLGRQQQEVSRQSVIKALPLQAQIAAAQGNLDFAQKQLDTTFQLISADAKQAYDYQKSLRDAVFAFATEEQKSVLDAQQKIDDRNYTLAVNNLNNAQSIASQFMTNGQADIAAKITALNPASSTFVADLAKLQAAYVPKADSSGSSGGSSGSYKISTTNQGKLIATGLTPDEINHIISGINQYGLPYILSNQPGLSTEQKNVLQQIFTSSPTATAPAISWEQYLHDAESKAMMSFAPAQVAALKTKYDAEQASSASSSGGP